MPRNGSGTSSVVNTFVIDTIADPDEVNANFTDVADQLTNSLPRDGQAGMTAPLPLQNGTAAAPALTFTSDTDTGFYRSGANRIGVALGGVGVPLGLGPNYVEKSGDYTAVATDIGSVIRFTATATLSFDPAANLDTDWNITVIAGGGDVTIDPDASETIDGATTLIIPNGSSERIICSGTAFYTERKLQPFATLASATTTDLGTVGSQNVTVTGTTTITGFGTVAAGTFRRVVFSGALTLTHNATSLILPNNGLNITTAAGDALEAVSLGSGNWRVTDYQKANPSQLNRSGPVSVSTTAVDVAIPAGVTMILMVLANVSTNGVAPLLVQIGDSGGIESSGYACTTLQANFNSAVAAVTASGSFQIASVNAASNSMSGIVTLILADAATNTWIESGSISNSGIRVDGSNGSKSLSGQLTTVRLTTSGTDTFDAGQLTTIWSF